MRGGSTGYLGYSGFQGNQNNKKPYPRPITTPPIKRVLEIWFKIFLFICKIHLKLIDSDGRLQLIVKRGYDYTLPYSTR
jgi:hypothetical protein